MNDRLLTEFLLLRDFNEYMEKYPLFCGLKMGTSTFRKEMELMERDETHTHREKEAIRELRKRAVIKQLQEQIVALQAEISREGVWRLPIEPSEPVEIRYVYPDDKRGDINHYLAGLTHDPESVGDNVFKVTLHENEYPLIELLAFPERPLFLQADHGWDSPGVSFLLRYNRIAQIERLMSWVNYRRRNRSDCSCSLPP